MSKRYNYIGIKYTQGQSKKELLSFCASANDIHAWGGIPTKTERFHGGFQRALSDRYKKIIQFFNEGQTSPTSVVVAFREGALQVTDLGYPAAWLSEDKLSAKPSFAHVQFAFEERDPDSEDLAALVKAVCDMLRPRLDASEDSPTTEAAVEAGDEAGEQEAAGSEAEEFEISLDSATDDDEEEPSLEIDVGQSKLRAFYDFLNTPGRMTEWLETETKRYEALKAAKARTRADKEFVALTPEQRLKTSLVSLLKPAMIVDGQHRIIGAYQSANAPITFNVCAIKDADWVEQVFQFVILNKLAKPISSSFLTALLNTSLTNRELKEIEPRLETVNIKNTDRILMKYINFSENSPFFEMVSQPGDMAGIDNQGKLSDKGMLRIAKRWYNLTTSNTELRMFLPAIEETHITKARKKWHNHDVWSGFFYAFWAVLKKKYTAEGVWEKRHKNPLLYIVTLMTLQDLFLEKKAGGDSQFKDRDDFVDQVERFFEKVPGAFFVGWEATGLQSGQGPDHIKAAVTALREGRQLGKVKDESELFRKI